MTGEPLIAIRIFDPALLNDFFKTRDILQKTFAAEAEEIIAELWILEVNFQQPVIGHGQDFAILNHSTVCVRRLSGDRNPSSPTRLRE